MENAKLLIDADCPMCCLYGKAFVKTGLLTEDGLSPYQNTEENICKSVDMDRARNEIALFDGEKTVYGPDALLSILAQGNPLVMRISNWAPMRFLLNHFYAFISYNRKVIYPVKRDLTQVECRPDYNAFYRWSFILFVAITTGMLLNFFVLELSRELHITHFWWREYLICFGQVAWQFTAVALICRKREHSKRMEYLGNMSTVSFIGGLLLIPVLLIEANFNLGLFFLLPSFFTVVLFMFFEHIRRCKIIGLPLGMTFSWILFRVFALAVIVSFIVLSK